MVKCFAYMWEFRVKPDSVGGFIKLYGPDGDWVKLFANAEGYIRTELHRDVHESMRFVTIDYWESIEHLQRFRTEFATKIDEIDEIGDAMTESEEQIGEFTSSF